jgi:hypothetical protein
VGVQHADVVSRAGCLCPAVLPNREPTIVAILMLEEAKK